MRGGHHIYIYIYIYIYRERERVSFFFLEEGGDFVQGVGQCLGSSSVPDQAQTRRSALRRRRACNNFHDLQNSLRTSC